MMQATSTILAFLLVVRATFMGLAAPALCNSSQLPPPYQLIYQTDSTTELTGSVVLKCRDHETAEELDINTINFFLNRTSATDLRLRDRGDISVDAVGNTGIKFNLTRGLEGDFTCGKIVDCTNVMESLPVTLICKSDLAIIILLYTELSDAASFSPPFCIQHLRLLFHCCLLFKRTSLQCQVTELSYNVQSNQALFFSNIQ